MNVGRNQRHCMYFKWHTEGHFAVFCPFSYDSLPYVSGLSGIPAY